MEDSHVNVLKLKNRNLVVVLIGLSIVAVVLLVAIVFVVLKNNNGGGGNEAELVVTEEDLIEGETMEDAKQRMLVDAEMEKNKKEIEGKVEKLLEASEVDVDAINDLYNDGIDKAIQAGRKDYVVDLVLSRNDAFLTRNLKREALDAMLAVDAGMFDNIEKYYYYTEIIELAEKLGDEELVAHYKKERKAIEADFNRENEERDRDVEEMGSEEDAWWGKEEERE